MNINDILEAIANGPFGNKTKGMKMTDIIDDIEKGLVEHGQIIDTIEAFMEKHATEASKNLDPMRLQSALATIKGHSTRLAALLTKYPVIAPKLDVPPPAAPPFVAPPSM